MYVGPAESMMLSIRQRVPRRIPALHDLRRVVPTIKIVDQPAVCVLGSSQHRCCRKRSLTSSAIGNVRYVRVGLAPSQCLSGTLCELRILIADAIELELFELLEVE